MRKRRYRIAELLGRGGFGSVYKAEKLGEEGFSTIVAVKLLHAMGGFASNPEQVQQRADAVRRLRDEARLLGLLKHRAIVQVFDLEQLRGEWAIVMEYVPGMHLAELGTHTTIPVRQALAIVEEVSDALHHAYHFKPHDRELRLHHRDIKPSNVMVTAGGSVKVLDFGIARANFSARETHTAGFLVGTQRYMSPEHLDFDDDTIQVGPESDIYALGAVLFELVARQPFGRATLEPLKHQDKVLAQLDEHLLGQVPRDLYDLIKRMLSYSPLERPTAVEVRSACEALQQEIRGPSMRSWCERMVGPVMRSKKTPSTPRNDPLIGSVIEEGALPDEAFLDAYDSTVIGRDLPHIDKTGGTWGETPAAPAAPPVTPGAIPVEGEGDTRGAGLSLSPMDDPDPTPGVGGLDIAIDDDAPDWGPRTPRRRPRPPTDEHDEHERGGRMTLLGAGLGALLVVVAGIWGLSYWLDREAQPGVVDAQAPPPAVIEAEAEQAEVEPEDAEAEQAEAEAEPEPGEAEQPEVAAAEQPQPAPSAPAEPPPVEPPPPAERQAPSTGATSPAPQP